MKNKNKKRQLLTEELMPMILLAWESNGHSFGVDQHLQLRQLLQNLPDNQDLKTLKYLLAPVFADTPQQQEQFYDLFDKVYEQGQSKLKIHQQRIADLEKEEKEEHLGTLQQIFFSSVFLGLFLCLVTWGVYYYYNTPQTASSKTEITAPKDSDSKALAENDQTTKSTGVTTSDLPDKLKAKSTLLDTMTMTNDPSRAVESINTRISFGEGLAYFSWSKAAYLGFLAAMIWGIPWWLRRRRQSYTLVNQPQSSEPHSWNLKIPNLGQINLGAVFTQNLRAMLRLDQKPSQGIDVHKTVEASVSNAGAIDFHYLSFKERRPYLILQDITAPQDHRSKLIDHFVKRLQTEGAPIELYYFKGDPRTCWQADESKPTSLEQLAHSTQNHQLILCSDAQSLLSGGGKQLADWTNTFAAWRKKLLLNSRAYSEWNEQENILAQAFRLLPTTPNSLSLLVEALETTEPLDYAKTGEVEADLAFYETLIIPEPTAHSRLITLLQENFVYPEQGETNTVLLKWIAGCAIPPVLFWDWTLHVGQLLSSSTRNELQLENLFQLIRLPWFIEGEMPNECRRILLDYLEEKEPEYLTSLRESWDTFLNLEENLPPPGSLAWEGHRMQVLLNELLKDPSWVEKRKLELELENLLNGKQAQDALLIKYQEQKQEPASDRLLSNRFREYVQAQSNAFETHRPWIWQLPLFIFTAALSFIVHYTEPVTTFQFKDRVTALAFTEDSKSFLVASGFGGLALCTVEGEWVQGLEEKSSPIVGLSNSVPGQIQAVSRDNATYIWDVSGVPLHWNKGERRLVHDIAFHPNDPNLVLIGCGERRAELWNIKKNEIRLQLDHVDVVNAVAFSPDGKYLLTGSSDGLAKLWNEEGTLLQVLERHESKIHDVAFSPDGKYLATASRDNTAKVWNMRGEEIHTLVGHDYDVFQVAFSPDNRQLITAGGDDLAILWSIENGEKLRTFGGHGNYLTHAIFSPDGRYLLTGDREGKVKLWKIYLTSS